MPATTGGIHSNRQRLRFPSTSCNGPHRRIAAVNTSFRFMILADTEIHDLIQAGMVQHYLPELINPASLDLRLGNLIMLESVESHQMIPLDISKYTAEHPYNLVPGQFILAQTIEVFHMPEDIAGLFFLKSSRAREGYENLHAGYADPGWHGSALTLELKNARQLQPLSSPSPLGTSVCPALPKADLGVLRQQSVQVERYDPLEGDQVLQSRNTRGDANHVHGTLQVTLLRIDCFLFSRSVQIRVGHDVGNVLCRLLKYLVR